MQHATMDWASPPGIRNGDVMGQDMGPDAHENGDVGID